MLVFSEDKYIGAILARLSLPQLLRQTVNLEFTQRYRVALFDDTGRMLATSTFSEAPVDAPRYEVPIPLLPDGLSVQDSPLKQRSLIDNALVWLVGGLSLVLMATLVALGRREARQAAVEHALRAETAFRRAMEDSVATGMELIDREGVIRHVNPAFCQMTGWPQGGLIGRGPPYPYWPPGRTEQYEALLAEDGEQVGWMSAMADITEPKRISEQLALAHERFTTVLESLDAAVSVVAANDSEELLFANRQYRDRYGANAACVALIQQQDRSAELQGQMKLWLTLKPPETRELAAEYFTWLGGPEVLPDLEAALEREQDVYAAAALRAASATIRLRPAPPARSAPPGRPPVTEAPAPAPSPAAPHGADSAAADCSALARRLGLDRCDLTASCTRALALLRAAPAGAELRADLLAWFGNAERMEPHLELTGAEPKPAFEAARLAWCLLRSALHGLPGPAGESEEFAGRVTPPATTSLIPPVRDYFDLARRSFGNKVGEEIPAIGNMVHVGDDVHWYKDHRTVVAIGPGVVRQAGFGSSWGYMIVLEHLTKGGERFGSLYAYLDSGLRVRPAEVVAQGRKLGVVGRGYRWANGGYAAHLHFAIHRGPYRQTFRLGSSQDIPYLGRLYRGVVLYSDIEQTVLTVRRAAGSQLLVKPTSWISGYVRPWKWKEFAHAWSDPQRLIAKYLPEGWKERPSC